MSSNKPVSKTFYKGDVIFREGDKGNVAYMIQSGTVNIVKNIKGKQNVLATLGAGELFGEMAIITKSERVAGAEAASECSLLVLTARLILLLLKKSHPTVFHLTRILASRLANANRTISDNRSDNSWMTFCRFMHMKQRVIDSTPPDIRPIGLDFDVFCKELIDITNMPKSDITKFMKSAAGFNMLSTNRLANNTYVSITDPDNFLEIAESISGDINKFGGKVCLADYMDIDDFARMVESNPEMIYKKVGVGEFPEDICVLHKEATAKWAEKKGVQYFKESRRKRKSIDELEDVNDIVFVDIGTLKQAFRKIGYYKIGILLAIAEGDARKRIIMTLSKKIAGAIMKESRASEAIDQTEADDVEEELIDIIRDIKSSDIK
ncbi:Crp/Fnr family transcriptional regulator [Maridesulfovibrio hydrothermalis]|uniref:Putative transcriptional regulator, Crp/Fnr family n=1 Tax=Maridesulfovibrio hydrothermalis AM13 = DSM 14728 TaxID=1121451 RepID=L0RE69_9BACT|nr:cyclic nucleotide-binding domain-containing protein [Maridesulfovibrio hydrothermalis]CCO24475.1 putative transcriptional regulator, Crp/Fnr family [Maridesulfovibrio hydrothermalis AM13 = DSM 14728]